MLLGSLMRQLVAVALLLRLFYLLLSLSLPSLRFADVLSSLGEQSPTFSVE